MSDTWTARLSEYVDEELSTAEAMALEQHLSTCAECARTLEELRGVVARAGGLEDRPPSHDLWPGIAARIGAARKNGGDADVVDLRHARRRRLVSFSIPQLVAAGVALLLIGGSAVWLTLDPPGTAGEVATTGAEIAPAAARFVGQDYDLAVAQLEQALAVYRNELDTATVRVVEENLAIIDRAIAEARAALAIDPASVYLNAHLAATLRRKVQLLQRAVALAEG